MIDNQPSPEYFTLKTMPIKKHNFRADTIIYSHDHDYDILGDSIKNKKPNKITSQKKENLIENIFSPVILDLINIFLYRFTIFNKCMR